MKSQIQQSLKVFKENTVDLIPEEELTAKLEKSLKENKPLKLKVGFDPTARDIHLGHTVLLRKLRKLQDLGHQVYFIIGDFTAKIGDPSGKTTLRPILSDNEIESNAQTYTSQAFKILDASKTTIIYNSIWYKDKKLADFLQLLSQYTVAQILEREDFSKRIKENRPLTLLEIIYPLIQGYDSVELCADVEFGGTDQKFNLLVGRYLQTAFGKAPQVIATMPLLVGLDGKNKMSKSLGNYIGVTEDAKSMFGKIMSISDDVMWEYFRLLTDIDIEPVKTMHPKEAKMLLATDIVSFYHSREIALAEKDEFQKVFSQGAIPEKILVYEVKADKIDLLDVLVAAKLIVSKNEGRRLLTGGSISVIESETVSKVLTEQNIDIPSEGLVLKVGKKRFLKVIKTQI